MEYIIQYRNEDFITIYIDMIEYCNDITLKREKRCAFIGKRNKPSLYLGGKVIFNGSHFIFEEISKPPFKESGVDFNLWIELFKKIYKNLNNK